MCLRAEMVNNFTSELIKEYIKHINDLLSVLTGEWTLDSFGELIQKGLHGKPI